MAKEAMPDHIFEQLLASINQETRSTDKKVEILFNSRGFFSALQASRILYAFGNPSDKLRAMQILEARLCRMTCSEGRDIIGAFSIQNDKVKALEAIKRYLCDTQTRDGRENMLIGFPFEADKMKALNVLSTVRSDKADLIPAGGHQGYAALGGLYTQCRPMVPHLYGPAEQQQKQRAGSGQINIPVEAKAGVLPSMYTGHPSYAYPQGRDYAQDRQYPGNGAYGQDMSYASGTGECPSKPLRSGGYPAGGPPLGMHQGGAAATGFLQG